MDNKDVKIKYSVCHKLEADTALLEAIGFKSGDIGSYVLSHEVTVPEGSVALIKKALEHPQMLKVLLNFAEKYVKNITVKNITPTDQILDPFAAFKPPVSDPPATPEDISPFDTLVNVKLWRINDVGVAGDPILEVPNILVSRIANPSEWIPYSGRWHMQARVLGCKDPVVQKTFMTTGDPPPPDWRPTL